MLFNGDGYSCGASLAIRAKCYIVDFDLQKEGEELVFVEEAKQIPSQVSFAKLSPRRNDQKTDAHFDRFRRVLHIG